MTVLLDQHLPVLREDTKERRLIWHSLTYPIKNDDPNNELNHVFQVAHSRNGHRFAMGAMIGRRGAEGVVSLVLIDNKDGVYFDAVGKNQEALERFYNFVQTMSIHPNICED